MAFDVYVGTMTRFYRRDWENVAQRMAKEQGITYSTIYAGGTPGSPPPAADIRRAVAGWCKVISGGLEGHGFGPIAWDEGDSQPYFTDRPTRDGYSGLLIWASHSEHPDLPWPSDVPDSWTNDPAFKKSTGPDFGTQYRTILEPQLWLPTDFPFVFEAPTLVSDDKSRIGSVFTLKRQLGELRSRTAERFNRSIGGDFHIHKSASPDGQVQVPARRDSAKPGLADAAKFGLQIFYDLATKACEYRLPILLNY